MTAKAGITEAGEAHLALLADQRARQAAINRADRLEADIAALTIGTLAYTPWDDTLPPDEAAARRKGGLVVHIREDEDTRDRAIVCVTINPGLPVQTRRWRVEHRHTLSPDQVGQVNLLGPIGMMGKVAALLHVLADSLGSTWTWRNEELLRWALSLRDLAGGGPRGGLDADPDTGEIR